MPRDFCLLFLLLCVCALAERSVLEKAKEIGASFQGLPSTKADAELVEHWPDVTEEDRVADAYWDLEDKLFFSTEKRDVAAGTKTWSTQVPSTYPIAERLLPKLALLSFTDVRREGAAESLHRVRRRTSWPRLDTLADWP